MLKKYKWGTNPYYYLAGKYGIHPTYIQSMSVKGSPALIHCTGAVLKQVISQF